jgi:hypothetical protein
MVDSIVYNEGEISIGDVKRQHLAGAIHVCGHCGTELVVAFTNEEAALHKMGRGIFCPKDLKHVNVMALGPRPSTYKD